MKGIMSDERNILDNAEYLHITPNSDETNRESNGQDSLLTERVMDRTHC